jgi:heavy metal sensor kinase
VGARLTLWYAAALAGVLLAYAVVVFLFLRHELYKDLDRRLREDLAQARQALEPDGAGGLQWVGANGDTGAARGRWLEVWRADGRLLLTLSPPEPLGLPAPERAAATGAVTLRRSDLPVRVLSRSEAIAGLPVITRAARSEGPLRHELRELLIVQAIGLPVGIALASLGGYKLARRALAPLARMAESARGISAERLDERLPVANPSDELGHLAVVFNDTFARLERSFEQMRRFTADASHELRTPLTALRSVGEVGLQKRPDDELFGEVIGSMLEEVDRLTRLVDTLLTLSRADAGQAHLAREPLELAALARDVAECLNDLADEKGQRLEVEATAPAEIQGDRLVLRQAVVNVVDNAIKYSARDVAIRIRVGRSQDRCWIEVEDRGPGIAAEHRERVFERFYRVDRARSRELGGTGLGLALARWAVEGHRGRIELDSEPGRGSVFRIVLPAAAGPPPRAEPQPAPSRPLRTEGSGE